MKSIDFKRIKKRVARAVDALGSTVVIPRWGAYSPNFYYFAGMDLDHSILVLHKDGRITLISNRLNESLVKDCYGNVADVVICDKNNTAKEALHKACGKAKCALDVSAIPYAVYRKIHSREMKPVSKELLYVREVKEKNEIELMRIANKKAIGIINRMRAMKNITEKSESELKRDILVEIAKQGCREAFDTIVANSKNARYPHYTAAGDERIEDYVLVDMGVQYKNYNSDVTRCIGELGDMRGVYEKLKHTSLEVADIAYAGKKICDFVDEVNVIIKRNGLNEFPHGIGHGIGLEVHEFPYFHAKSKDTLKENAVITIEPGQYGKKGIRYENMYVIGKKRAELI
ncbi:MAG: M24 family metallopeptidase [Candidatus Micrarchaeia archaeon]